MLMTADTERTLDFVLENEMERGRTCNPSRLTDLPLQISFMHQAGYYLRLSLCVLQEKKQYIEDTPSPESQFMDKIFFPYLSRAMDQRIVLLKTVLAVG